MFGVGSARWPDRPHQNGVAHWFCLIAASDVSVAVHGEKTGGNGVEGTFNRDITKDEMTFVDTENRQALEPIV